MQNQVVDDEQANFLQVEQKFKNGTATLEAYNEASKKYNDEAGKSYQPATSARPYKS